MLRTKRAEDLSAAPVMTPVPMADVLARVEARLAERLSSREPLLSEISTHLVDAGGKRVRPMVAVLVYRACGGRGLDDIVDVAAALELIHSATLLHDDIIDASDTRRGRPSAYRRFGLAHTLVTGDFVFSRAFQLCARFEERLIHWAAEACVSLTEGEVMQSRFRNNPAATVADYLEIISRKTACIFQQGARTAAHLAGAAAPVVDAMAACGFNIGMTFQIVDDILDLEGDENRTGKPAAIDLRDGNPSLPVVLALERDPEVGRLFAVTDPPPAVIDELAARIRASGVMAEARTLARDYAKGARANLDVLFPSAERDQLVRLTDQLVRRVS